MNVVLAALDNSLATNPVLASARALARLLGARVEAVHVVDDGAAPDEAAAAAGVPLRLERGPVVEALVHAATAEGVAAVVVGARGTLSSDHPLGSTALAVVTQLRDPVVVVPPASRVAPTVHRALLVLTGSTSDGVAPDFRFEPAPGAVVEVVARDLGDHAAASVCSVARETEADLIVLGWAEWLSPLRTPVVMEALSHANLPVMLVPVHSAAKPA